jgi:L,D-peptidoglycan transpeptidase YkuD (ErfK/YbiS/YcfS/YnhG family)
MRRSMAFFSVFFFVIRAACAADAGAATPSDSTAAAAKQIVVCIAPKSTSSEGTLQLFQRDATGAWQADGDRWPVMFARAGLAWGRGLNPPQPGPQKRTGDHRNPAGLFRLGPALGYAPSLPDGAAGWPYHQVTDRDAWIDDPALPDFNHLVTLPPGAAEPSWWGREHMHLGDMAYRWMVVIEHNYDSPQGDAGNSIFFHVRRAEHYRTAGCTTMEQDNLVRLIKWLKPGSNAMMVELTRADYERLWQTWHLPPAEKAL